MEYLVENGYSSANISNNMAGIRANFIMNGLDTAPFRNDQIAMYHKALKLNIPFTPRKTFLISTDCLRDIVRITKSLPNSDIFVSLYTLAFFSCLRLSNLLPHSVKNFDIHKHLAKGDIILSDKNATLIIKWSKTIQNRRDIATVVVPRLGTSQICPVTPLEKVLEMTPHDDNAPVFQILRNHGYVPLTDSVARKHLAKVARLLNIERITFHDFRRSGTTWAHEHGVPIDAIKAHGTWKSDVVYSYIATNFKPSQKVSDTFQQHLLT